MTTNGTTEKDKQIIRQSQLKLVLDYATQCGYCISLTDLIKTATMMEMFVIEGFKTSNLDRYEALDKHLKETYGNGTK
jgi:aerobic-type carbon monoxide dehydrogenase small subunit (CoxS/CutS family)